MRFFNFFWVILNLQRNPDSFFVYVETIRQIRLRTATENPRGCLGCVCILGIYLFLPGIYIYIYTNLYRHGEKPANCDGL